MGCNALGWDGKRSLTLRVRSRKQFHCFTNNIKVMTRFCLSRLKLSPVPVLIFSSGGNQKGDATIDRATDQDEATDGRTDDRLTDWLTGWRTVMRCLRLHYDWVSNLIAYTNFIYVTWVHFVAPSVHRGMKVSSFPEEEDHRKWSVAICNAFSLGSQLAMYE